MFREVRLASHRALGGLVDCSRNKFVASNSITNAGTQREHIQLQDAHTHACSLAGGRGSRDSMILGQPFEKVKLSLSRSIKEMTGFHLSGTLKLTL